MSRRPLRLAFLDILAITPKYPSRETRRHWYASQARPIGKLSARPHVDARTEAILDGANGMTEQAIPAFR